MADERQDSTPRWQSAAVTGALPRGALPTLQQHPRYAATLSLLGRLSLVYRLRQGGRTQATVQVLCRELPVIGRVGLVSGGPVWAPGLAEPARASAYRGLLARLRADLGVAAITPLAEAGGDPLDRSGWLAAMTPPVAARLDLGPDPAAERARQHGKWRNRLAAAERGALCLRNAAMPDRGDHWLIAAEIRQRKARGYSGLPPGFSLAWIRRNGADAARLFWAEAAGEPVAGMVFLLHPPTATYQIGWSGPVGRRLGAHPLLLSRAMGWLRRQGVRAVDLGPLDTDRAPGLARVKLGAGARPRVFGASLGFAPPAPGPPGMAGFRRIDTAPNLGPHPRNRA
ncbi:MAG: GNAT family N-acetyltransferase, partial [Pseudomonadota bacterium]